MKTGRRSNVVLPLRSFGAWVLYIYAPKTEVGRRFKSMFTFNVLGTRPMRPAGPSEVKQWMRDNGRPECEVKIIEDIYRNYRGYCRQIKAVGGDLRSPVDHRPERRV